MQTDLKASFKRLVVIACLGLLLSACSTGEGGPRFPSTIEVSSGPVIGQTVLAGWDGLNGIEVYLTPNGALPDVLRISLFAEPEDRLPLWGGDIPVPQDLGASWFRLPIEVQPGSAGSAYFITFETKSERTLALSTGPGGQYLDGALHRDGRSLDQQLEFRLKYHPVRLVLGLFGDGLAAIGVLVGCAWLFTLPGWALLSAFWVAWERQGLLARVILATAAGVAVYPILLIPPWLFGLHLGPIPAWIVPPVALVSFVGRYRRGSWSPAFKFKRPDYVDGLLTIGLLAVLISRLLPLRLLEVGMWGDSYQHTLITQLLLDRGGLFSSWEPYAPIATFTYHFGFHTTAAVMSWLMELSAATSVLWAGQLFNFLAVAALVPLTNALLETGEGRSAGESRTWLPGLVALVTAGLVSQMPAYYINWGRYTQIAGQFLLAAWMIVVIDHFRADRGNWKAYIPAWVLLAGLALTHYRVLIFALLFITAYWLVHIRTEGIVRAIRETWRIGYGAAVLFLPWFWNVFSGELMAMMGILISTPAQAVTEQVANYVRLNADLELFLPLPVWGLLPVILVWGLARRERIVALIGLWSLLLVLVANPASLGLPGAGAINNFAVLIAAYIPAAILMGAGSVWAIELVGSRLPSIEQRWQMGAGGAFLVLCIWGAAGQVGLVQPRSHVLVTRPDRAAFEWVKDNVPGDAVFLVNFFSTDSGALAGSDGGWWLPYFTGRESILPPFNFISEKPKSPDLRLDLLDLDAALREAGPEDPATQKLLEAFGVTHVYLGQRQGLVNSGGDRIKIQSLLESERFELIYQADRVWIFAFSGD